MSPVIKSGHRRVGFGEHSVIINAYGTGAEDLIDFLCCDLQVDSDAMVQGSYDLMIVGANKQMVSLWLAGRCLYSGENRYDLAYVLINEIIHQCIVDNKTGPVIHAAAIASEAGAVLLPGKSGAGKSTLTAWLLSQGCQYLTDELVLVTGPGRQLHPFTRPLSLKNGAAAVLDPFLSYAPSDVLSGGGGFMLPHRLVNSEFTRQRPPLSLVLFPEYKAGAPTELTKISAALGCARLLECYVNARNIPGHGVAQLAEIARATPLYELSYGGFLGLHEVLLGAFPGLFRGEQ